MFPWYTNNKLNEIRFFFLLSPRADLVPLRERGALRAARVLRIGRGGPG